MGGGATVDRRRSIRFVVRVLFGWVHDARSVLGLNIIILVISTHRGGGGKEVRHAGGKGWQGRNRAGARGRSYKDARRHRREVVKRLHCNSDVQSKHTPLHHVHGRVDSIVLAAANWSLPFPKPSQHCEISQPHV